MALPAITTPDHSCAACLWADSPLSPDDDLHCTRLNMPVSRHDICDHFQEKPSRKLLDYTPAVFDCKPMGVSLG